jgi:hypothetical protein
LWARRERCCDVRRPCLLFNISIGGSFDFCCKAKMVVTQGNLEMFTYGLDSETFPPYNQLPPLFSSLPPDHEIVPRQHNVVPPASKESSISYRPAGCCITEFTHHDFIQRGPVCRLCESLCARTRFLR